MWHKPNYKYDVPVLHGSRDCFLFGELTYSGATCLTLNLK